MIAPLYGNIKIYIRLHSCCGNSLFHIIDTHYIIPKKRKECLINLNDNF